MGYDEKRKIFICFIAYKGTDNFPNYAYLNCIFDDFLCRFKTII